MKTLNNIHQIVTDHLNVAVTGLVLFSLLCLLIIGSLFTYVLVSQLYTKALRELSPKAFWHSLILVLSSSLVRGRWVDMHILKITHMLNQIREQRPDMYSKIKHAMAHNEKAGVSANQASEKPSRTAGRN